MIKRAMDLVLSLTALLFLTPLLLALVVLVRINLGSPVFFSQNRPGLNGKIFRLFKFRSMLDSQDEIGNTLPDEQRLTRFGRFLRSSSLDELPTLYNVIAGNMSLVGPRPLLVDYLPLYSKRQALRHNVKPGITGWAQINGRNAISWEDKFELDVWYVQNKSLLLDIKILLMTVGKVLQQSGISHAGSSTMPPFKGEDSQEG